MARPIVVIAFLTVGFGKFILFVKKSATNPTDKVKATFRIFGMEEIRPAFKVIFKMYNFDLYNIDRRFHLL